MKRFSELVKEKVSINLSPSWFSKIIFGFDKIDKNGITIAKDNNSAKLLKIININKRNNLNLFFNRYVLLIQLVVL